MQRSTSRDVQVLRDLAERYAEIAHKDVQEERRRLWTQLNGLQRTRPTVLASFGMHNVWCRDVFGDARMACEDPFYRAHERHLRMAIFQDDVGDDCILEPWITQRAAVAGQWGQIWGVAQSHSPVTAEGGSWQFDPPVKDWSDVARLRPTPHYIDEAATAREVARLEEAVGDILPVNVERGPIHQDFLADISTDLTGLRGLEQVMRDVYESPRQLHALLAFMRDGILAAQDAAEAAGDFSLTSQSNQAMTYCRELEPPRANSGPRLRKELWCHCSAQEFTLISPAMHDEFMLQYQLPIISRFGMVSYGCCEDLTRKIDMLRQVPNLRIIAVPPRADVARCAEQIGTDYVISWRPSPADMVCCQFDEDLIRRTVRNAMEACKGCCVTIHLKDVETVQGEPDRLGRWVQVVRSITDDYA
jgi:hypothetical protein